MDGTFEKDTLYLKKSEIGALIPLLSLNEIHWEERVLKMASSLVGELESAPLGCSFQGALFSYQKTGVDWLFFLYRSGFSALLADEMGLGKTVQVLAFLSCLRQDLPILVVAPKSLLFNWEKEQKRFAPSLQNMKIVSYNFLRANIEEFQKEHFEVVVLDESNAIKTASTQSAKAAKALKSTFRICLSGTPMENRVDELLSQFQFLMPDLVERKGSIESIKRKVRPFVLRRRKEEVGIDLPEKIEQTLYLDLTEEQKALYQSYKDQLFQKDLEGKEILKALLRLRQICIDPRLVEKSADKDSWDVKKGAKISRILLDIEEIVAQGSKVLVFSQFTEALQLIYQEVPNALYLDGEISAKKRGDLVEQFQQDDTAQVFLLSLKAGGVGLNLTAADYVLILDPWWNEAVEKQAIDRAHRIGQKKKVIAKRYVTTNTIEEKILRLQQEKQKTADQLLDSSLATWTKEDLLFFIASDENYTKRNK